MSLFLGAKRSALITSHSTGPLEVKTEQVLPMPAGKGVSRATLSSLRRAREFSYSPENQNPPLMDYLTHNIYVFLTLS